jgi:hypothetical protein
LFCNTWQAIPGAKVLAFDLISGVLDGFCKLGAPDVKNSGQTVEPQISIGSFHDSGNSAEPVAIDRNNVVESSVLKLL